TATRTPPADTVPCRSARRRSASSGRATSPVAGRSWCSWPPSSASGWGCTGGSPTWRICGEGAVLAYGIDHTHRVVRAKAQALLTAEEMFAYQREVWSRPDVAGYDELIDVSGVERIVQPSPVRIAELADLSARMDAEGALSRLAIVAPDDFAFGLGRMYQAYR